MIVSIVIMLLMFLQGGQADNDFERYLQEGLHLEQQGQPEQALQLWQQAVSELEIPSVAIATEYLRVATRYKLDDYYQTASFNYQWGMSGNNKIAMNANRQALKEELARLEPLLEQPEFKDWQAMLEKNDPALFDEIKQFWKRLDIRPATVYNERLIEHWQRIAYARQQFTRENEPPYRTDARGHSYVRYGEPHRIDSGRVDVTRDRIRGILQQIMPAPTPDNPDPTRGNLDLMLVSNRISQLFLNSYYEIWIYNSPEAMNSDNLGLIFGHKSGGSFGRLDIVEDFIPPEGIKYSLGRQKNTP